MPSWPTSNSSKETLARRSSDRRPEDPASGARRVALGGGGADRPVFLKPRRSAELFVRREGRRVLREADFCDAEGRAFRMDRVVVDPEAVTVVDFKTGVDPDAERRAARVEADRAQVRSYMRILGEVVPRKTPCAASWPTSTKRTSRPSNERRSRFPEGRPHRRRRGKAPPRWEGLFPAAGSSSPRSGPASTCARPWPNGKARGSSPPSSYPSTASWTGSMPTAWGSKGAPWTSWTPSPFSSRSTRARPAGWAGSSSCPPTGSSPWASSSSTTSRSSTRPSSGERSSLSLDRVGRGVDPGRDAETGSSPFLFFMSDSIERVRERGFSTPASRFRAVAEDLRPDLFADVDKPRFRRVLFPDQDRNAAVPDPDGLGQHGRSFPEGEGDRAGPREPRRHGPGAPPGRRGARARARHRIHPEPGYARTGLRPQRAPEGPARGRGAPRRAAGRRPSRRRDPLPALSAGAVRPARGELQHLARLSARADAHRQLLR